MTAISETPIKPGSFKYGRYVFIVWDVQSVEEGYEYQYVEVPIDSNEAAIIQALQAEGINGEEAMAIMANIQDTAII